MQEIHGKNSSVPGEPMDLKKQMMCAGQAMLSKFTPVNQICNHIVGFHFYSGDIKRQVEAHHYCSALNSEFMQCVIYDSDKADAKLIGVEYIVSEKIFQTLPEEERKYWHSHVYEVKSGILTFPEVPYTAEKMVMADLITTYGKTIHFWQVDRGDNLPLGEPKLMMAFTQDGQVNMELVDRRDKEYGISTLDNKKNRADIEIPQILSGADGWKKGSAVQFEVKEVPMSGYQGTIL